MSRSPELKRALLSLNRAVDQAGKLKAVREAGAEIGRLEGRWRDSAIQEAIDWVHDCAVDGNGLDPGEVTAELGEGRQEGLRLAHDLKAGKTYRAGTTQFTKEFIRPANPTRNEVQTKHAARMFKWHNQVANDPESRRQAIAMKVVNFVREKLRADSSNVELDQRWLAGELGVTTRGLQKAINWLRDRGHLIVHVRKHLHRPNLYEAVIKPIRTGAGLDPVRIGGGAIRTPVRIPIRTPVRTNPISDAPPAGRQMFILQKWGLSAEQGRDLVNHLQAIAGQRRDLLEQLFTRLERRVRWDHRRKINQLHAWADRMEVDPEYWPTTKKSRPDLGAKEILAALQSGPCTKAELIELTKKTAAAIASVTQSMCAAGEIVRISPGVFALPTVGADAHVPASDAVLYALTMVAREMTTAEIVTATCKSRTAVDAALFRLRESGTIVTVRRGVFALAQKVAAG
jgi:biotin operon repressor